MMQSSIVTYIIIILDWMSMGRMRKGKPKKPANLPETDLYRSQMPSSIPGLGRGLLGEGGLPLLVALALVALYKVAHRLIQEHGHGLARLPADLVQRADMAAVDLGLIEPLVVAPAHPLRGHVIGKLVISHSRDRLRGPGQARNILATMLPQPVPADFPSPFCFILGIGYHTHPPQVHYSGWPVSPQAHAMQPCAL